MNAVNERRAWSVVILTDSLPCVPRSGYIPAVQIFLVECNMPDSETTVAIRSVRPDDLPAIAAFIEPFVKEGKLLPRTTQELDDLLAHGFVAEAAGTIVGFAALEIYSPKMSEIRSLAVAPEFRGVGVGKRLVQCCVERAKEFHVLEIMAITSNEQFFKRCGFDFTLPGEKKALFLQTREL
jgi:N-acetylglutamate synthase-like GNAT family acetyltransferase